MKSKVMYGCLFNENVEKEVPSDMDEQIIIDVAAFF